MSSKFSYKKYCMLTQNSLKMFIFWTYESIVNYNHLSILISFVSAKHIFTFVICSLLENQFILAQFSVSTRYRSRWRSRVFMYYGVKKHPDLNHPRNTHQVFHAYTVTIDFVSNLTMEFLCFVIILSDSITVIYIRQNTRLTFGQGKNRSLPTLYVLAHWDVMLIFLNQWPWFGLYFPIEFLSVNLVYYSLIFMLMQLKYMINLLRQSVFI